MLKWMTHNWLFILVFSKIHTIIQQETEQQTYRVCYIDSGWWGMRLLELWQCSGVAAARRSNYAAIFYQFGHILGSSSVHWPRVSRVTCPHLPQRLVRKLTPNYSSIRASTDGGRGLVTCSLSHLHSLVTRKWVKIPLSTDRASTEVTLTWCKPNECNNEQFHCLDNSCSNRIIPLPSSICILRNAVYWRYVASCNSLTLAK